MTIELLSNLSLIKFSGDDAADFLQGQFTNDVKELGESNDEHNKWHFSGYCNPKGRLLVIFKLWQEGDDFYALLDTSLVDSIIKRLRMFVMRSKVSIEHIEYAAVIGALSKQTLDNFNLSDLSVENLQHGQLTFNKTDSILAVKQRYLIVLKVGLDQTNNNELGDGANWRLANIKDGFPTLTADTTELFIPQMLNLDLLGGINFKKGCYTGQEIVARLHYLGNLKQRMFVCDLSSESECKSLPGSKIYADQELSKAVGTLVNIDSQYKHALVVLRLDSIENELYLDDNNQIKIHFEQQHEF